MQPFRSPQEAYRRVDFDARVAGADSRQLVALCYEQLTGALGSALYAAESGDNYLKSRSLTRALSALTALTMGIDAGQPMAPALNQLYESARRAVLDSVLAFNSGEIGTIRNDFIEIGRAILN